MRLPAFHFEEVHRKAAVVACIDDVQRAAVNPGEPWIAPAPVGADRIGMEPAQAAVGGFRLRATRLIETVDHHRIMGSRGECPGPRPGVGVAYIREQLPAVGEHDQAQVVGVLVAVAAGPGHMKLRLRSARSAAQAGVAQGGKQVGRGLRNGLPPARGPGVMHRHGTSVRKAHLAQGGLRLCDRFVRFAEAIQDPREIADCLRVIRRRAFRPGCVVEKACLQKTVQAGPDFADVSRVVENPARADQSGPGGRVMLLLLSGFAITWSAALRNSSRSMRRGSGKAPLERIQS